MGAHFSRSLQQSRKQTLVRYSFNSQFSATSPLRPQLSCRFSPLSLNPALWYKYRAALSSLCVHNTIFLSGLSREADAFLDQPLADSHSPRRRLDKKKTQLGRGLRFSHQEDRSHDLGILFGDPAGITFWIQILHKVGHDLRYQRFEALVVPVLLGIQNAVTMYHPSLSAGAVRAQEVRRCCLRPRPELLLNCTHGVQKLFLTKRGTLPQHSADLALDRASSGANAFRPFAVSDKRLCRASLSDSVRFSNACFSKSRSMRLRYPGSSASSLQSSAAVGSFWWASSYKTRASVSENSLSSRCSFKTPIWRV